MTALAAGEDGPRRSLVLAGGGIRVAYQAGVLVALEEAGLRFHHADGTSGGTFNLAMLLSGVTPGEAAAAASAGRASCELRAASPAARRTGHPAAGLPRARRRRRARCAPRAASTGTFNVCDFAAKDVRRDPARRRPTSTS